MERSKNAPRRRCACSTHYELHDGIFKRERAPAFLGLAHDGREIFGRASKSPVVNFGPCSTLCLVARKHSSRDRDSDRRKRVVCFSLICAFCSLSERFERANKLKKETKSRYGRKKKKGSNFRCVCVMWGCMRSTNHGALREWRASPFFLPGWLDWRRQTSNL